MSSQKRPNVVYVRFFVRSEVVAIADELSFAGYEVDRRMGTGIIACYDENKLVFSASRLSNGRYFCRASGEYMTADGMVTAV